MKHILFLVILATCGGVINTTDHQIIRPILYFNTAATLGASKEEQRLLEYVAYLQDKEIAYKNQSYELDICNQSITELNNTWRLTMSLEEYVIKRDILYSKMNIDIIQRYEAIIAKIDQSHSKIQNKILETATNIGKRLNAIAIINNDGNVIILDPTYDITDEVIETLNREYLSRQIRS